MKWFTRHQIHPSETPDHISRLIVKMILTRTVIRPAGAQTWSNYKHNSTITYVIAVTSAGAFLSPGWGEKESRLWGRFWLIEDLNSKLMVPLFIYLILQKGKSNSVHSRSTHRDNYVVSGYTRNE